MADGTRQVVGDPLAFNPREQLPNRSLPLQGVRGNPSSDSGFFRDSEQAIGALSGLRKVVSESLASASEEAITQGKIDYMSGMTELQMRESGDYYRQKGYESLNAVNKANMWYSQEMEALERDAADLTPEQYKERLNKANAGFFETLPADPDVRKVYAAAFEDKAPRLAAMHMKAHADRNYERTEKGVSDFLMGGGTGSADFSRRQGSSNFAVSDTVVDIPYTSSDARDRDIAIRTMLGEAAGESDNGLAAVAHVLKNRTMDSRWGGSVADVALAPKQFSAWNKGAGGNNPSRWKPGSRQYERAGQIYDAVMEGRHIDPTNGATHYYSPAGMKLLVNEGSQTNLLPRWLQNERNKSGGEIKIGGHIFVGRADGKQGAGRRAQGPMPDDLPNDTGGRPEATRGPVSENDMVSAEEGIPTDRSTPQSMSEYQAFLREQNATLKPGRAAALLADTIVTQLQTGNTTALDNSGGIAMLQELGADNSDIRAVQTAIDRHYASQSKEFDEGRVVWEQDFLKSVEDNPNMDLETEILPSIREAVDAGFLTDAGAMSLTNKVLQKRAAEGRKSFADNPEAVAAINTVFRKFQDVSPEDEDYDEVTEQFASDIATLAESLGGNSSDVAGVIRDIYGEAARQRTRLETEARKVHEQARVNQERMSKVDSAIAAGTVPDPAGGTIKYNGKEYDTEGYYVAKLDDALSENLKKQFGVDEAAANPEQFGAMMDSVKYQRLIKAGVTDKESGQEMDHAIRGGITGPDNTVSEAAVMGLDKYMRISSMEGGGAYLQGMLSPDAAAQYTMAAELYRGGESLEGALRKMKAHNEELRKNPNYRAEDRAIYNSSVKGAVREAKVDALGGGWLSGFTGAVVNALPEILNANDAKIESWLTTTAERLKSTQPILDARNAVKMASDRLKDQSVIVGNQFVIAGSPQYRLDRVMGIEAFGKTAPNDAINTWLADYGQREWGQLWQDRIRKDIQPGERNPQLTPLDNDRRWLGQGYLPQYHVDQITDTANGGTMITINLLKDPAKPGDGYVGRPLIIPAQDIGNYYKEKQNTRSTGGKLVDTVREFFGRGAGGKFLFERQTPTLEELTN